MLPPVIRIVSGIHACPNRRISPAPCDLGPPQVAKLKPRGRPRESVDFTPKGSRTVRVQTVNAKTAAVATSYPLPASFIPFSSAA